MTDIPTPEEIRRVAAYLSSLGASKGGQARAKSLSPERRKEIAQKAARARWEKAKGNGADTGT